MTISNALSTHGLYALATPTGTLTGNDVRIGELSGSTIYTDADVAYSMLAFFADNSSTMTFYPHTALTSVAWVAGTAQVETATAAGTITASGNATVTVTAAGMTGSPKAISVAVLNTDTAATWAGKVRTALAADVDVAAMFDVSGTTTAIILTRKAVTTTTIGSLSIPRYAANDATLNIALANGTCTGITAAPTSTNTTAGVVTSGIKIYDGDGLDFEGVTLPTIVTLYGIMIQTSSGGQLNWTGVSGTVFSTAPNSKVLFSSTLTGSPVYPSDASYGTTANDAATYAYITVIGRTT